MGSERELQRGGRRLQAGQSRWNFGAADDTLTLNSEGDGGSMASVI